MVWLERLELPTTESIHCQQRNPQENQATKSNHTNPIRSYRILLHSRWTHASSSSVSPKDRPYILAWNWRDSPQNKLNCIHIETYFTVRQLSWSQGNFVKQGSPQKSTNWVQHLPSICASQEDARCAEAKMQQQKIVQHSKSKTRTIWIYLTCSPASLVDAWIMLALPQVTGSGQVCNCKRKVSAKKNMQKNVLLQRTRSISSATSTTRDWFLPTRTTRDIHRSHLPTVDWPKHPKESLELKYDMWIHENDMWMTCEWHVNDMYTCE